MDTVALMGTTASTPTVMHIMSAKSRFKLKIPKKFAGKSG